MSKASTHLATVCVHMKALIRRVGPPRIEADAHSPYEALIRAIAHQQLNGTAARTITGRLVALYQDTGGFPTPHQLLATDDGILRGCGFSGGKVAALRDIAARTLEGVVPTRAAAKRLSDAALVERLTSIRGVGRWTVEMLLMHTLGRPDVWPVDDFGVREGYRILHGLEVQPRPKVLLEMGEIYGPYRSAAAWYCWRAVDQAKAVKVGAVKVGQE